MRSSAWPGLGNATLGVKPTCGQGDAALQDMCKSECDPKYFLGKCAGTPPDGGGS